MKERENYLLDATTGEADMTDRQEKIVNAYKTFLKSGTVRLIDIAKFVENDESLQAQRRISKNIRDMRNKGLWPWPKEEEEKDKEEVIIHIVVDSIETMGSMTIGKMLKIIKGTIHSKEEVARLMTLIELFNGLSVEQRERVYGYLHSRFEI